MPADTKTIINHYVQLKTVSATAKASKVSEATARKVLLSAGMITTSRSSAIRELRKQDWSLDEIAIALGISRKAVLGHMPYTKGRYGSDRPTLGALRTRATRAKQKETRQSEENGE